MFPDYKEIPISLIKKYSNNSRKHSEHQIQQVVNSIREFGFTIRVWYNVYISNGVKRCIKLFRNTPCMKFQLTVK